MAIRNVQVTRYVTALREGGSLPAIAEADDGFLYVIKFRGAGQGVRALIAEQIGAMVAQQLGLKVPEFVFAHLDEAFGRTEPDEEIQDLLKASTGLNAALHYLSGAISYDPATHSIDAELASKIVWLDSFLLNMDRTVKNTNMLMWNKELWLIDHGAALYFHHNWSMAAGKSKGSFPMIKNHVLLPYATQLSSINENCKASLNDSFLQKIVQEIPETWLCNDPDFETVEAHRAVYTNFLTERLAYADLFVNEAEHARAALI